MTDLIALARQANGSVYTTMFDGWGVSFNAANIQAFAELIRLEEREACALIAQQTVCDTHIPTGVKIYGAYAAKAIRARTTT